MKITPISKAFFGVPEEDESFDLDAATRVFKWYMSDDSAEQVMVNVLAAEVPRLIEYHATEISKAMEKQFNERKEILKRAVINGVISKSMSDDTVDEISKAIDLIEKANSSYSLWERQENARKQWRNEKGQFREMGTVEIQQPLRGEKPIKDSEFNARTPAHHHPAPVKGLNAAQALKYQNAYAQISAVLAEAPYDNIQAVQTIKNGSGHEVVRNVWGNKPEDFISPEDFAGRNNVINMNLYSLNPQPFDTMRAAGMSRSVAQPISDQAQFGALNTERVKGFNDDWQRASAWSESGATRGMRRLGAASDFAEHIFGQVDDPRIKAAIKAGQWAGTYGPEAEKVIGPHARKSAYRYRGVERKPDSRLNNAFRSAISTATTPTDARTRIIYPRVTQQLAGRGQNARTVAVPVESPVINYMRSILPQEDLLRLHTNSGAIAPSQGIIIDAKGNLATQAVGYGDDHYLPFNLRNLKALKGGEYIRTRTLGGPTTEDVYTGMASGARAFTVVSHSGVYTVEFADDFRGGRRFNDKSARMVKRYGMLLDSLEAEQVTLSAVPKSRQDELMVKATGRFPGDDDTSRERRVDYFDRLIKEEQQDPKPSAEQKEEWAKEFLDQQAAKYDDGRGTELTWNDVRGQALANAAKESGQDSYEVARQFATPQSTIVAIGVGDEYKNFLKTKEREYATAQKPLRLNGEGYYKALQALQEQFPYYIANVEYRPWEKVSSANDKGYVKPRFNRPAAVRTGYWDPTIEGHEGSIPKIDARTGEKKKSGKDHADETNYQNWTARQNLKRAGSDDDKGKTGTERPVVPGSPGVPASPVAGGSLSPLEMGGRLAELGQKLNSDSLKVQNANKTGFVDNNDAIRAEMARAYPLLMGTPPEEIRRRYAAGDESFKAAIDDEAKRALKEDKFRLDDEFKRNFYDTGVKPTVPYSLNAGLTDRTAWMTFGDDSDATLGGNPDITAENIQQHVEDDEGLYNAAEEVKLGGLGDKEGLAKIDKGLDVYAQKMADLEQAQRTGEFARGQFAFHVPGVAEPQTTYEDAKEAINRQVRNLAKLRQAKRRYDEAMKRGGGNVTRIVEVGPDDDGGLKPGPNGTLPLGPNGTVPGPSFNRQDKDWLAANGMVMKKLTPIRKAYLRRK